MPTSHPNIVPTNTAGNSVLESINIGLGFVNIGLIIIAQSRFMIAQTVFRSIKLGLGLSNMYEIPKAYNTVGK